MRNFTSSLLLHDQSYDTDGSGELDEGEFVQVLVSAGWDQAEALDVFFEVNSDGEGGVGLEEFEAWWKGLLEREVCAWIFCWNMHS